MNHSHQSRAIFVLLIVLILSAMLLGCTAPTSQPTATLQPTDTPQPTATHTPAPTPTPDPFANVEYDSIITLGGEFNDYRAAVDEEGNLVALVDKAGEKVELTGEGVLVKSDQVYLWQAEEGRFEVIEGDLFLHQGSVWRFDRESQELTNLNIEASELVENGLGLVVMDEEGEITGVLDENGELLEYASGVLVVEGTEYEWVDGRWVEIEPVVCEQPNRIERVLKEDQEHFLTAEFKVDGIDLTYKVYVDERDMGDFELIRKNDQRVIDYILELAYWRMVRTGQLDKDISLEEFKESGGQIVLSDISVYNPCTGEFDYYGPENLNKEGYNQAGEKLVVKEIVSVMTDQVPEGEFFEEPIRRVYRYAGAFNNLGIFDAGYDPKTETLYVFSASEPSTLNRYGTTPEHVIVHNVLGDVGDFLLVTDLNRRLNSAPASRGWQKYLDYHNSSLVRALSDRIGAALKKYIMPNNYAAFFIRKK